MLKLISFISVFLIYKNFAAETPIIGILSQEKYIVASVIPEHYSSYIAASYVKYLESSGARVIPIWIGQNRDYYERVVNYTNGIFFPGGGTYFNETGGYGEAAKQIYELAVDANKRGVYYPIWGTCLGMQVLAFADVGTDIRIDCSVTKTALPLIFTEDFRSSRLFSKASETTIHILETQNVTYNQHRFCLTEDVLEKNDILDHWRIMTTNKDQKDANLEFISSMEHTKYPFYGVQFHPEKNRYEFKEKVGIPHTIEAIRISQYFSNIFVEECRNNSNSFPSRDMEIEALIYNFQPLFTGKKNSSYEQIYAFETRDYRKAQLL